jgi:hypothetical protein
MRTTNGHRLVFAALCLAALPALPALADATRGGPLGVPLPLFPADNWWNQDVSAAPLDPGSASFIAFIGATRHLHPDFGGYEDPGPPPSVGIYGFPYVVVNGDIQPKRAVLFDYSDESDGVDHDTDTSFPFYPIPDEAITEPYWIEAGPPGNQNPGGDRHMLIVDADNNYLYELYSCRGCCATTRSTAPTRSATRCVSPCGPRAGTSTPPRTAPAPPPARCRWARGCASRPASTSRR